MFFAKLLTQAKASFGYIKLRIGKNGIVFTDNGTIIK
jgi:hypothetical protein